ncbi:MAG TPA: Rid family hydrolase [Candidatus Paceibacterota bacterium]|nr:Rid family hydrolase [Verrucomicrobiota bacterium]HRY47552.1 Rid family hydrolase [Candidatus Paceibacterota bacterium]HSA02299.1 Rid family hydrolase [Candidatus Paceibacterota bacterium]
MITDVNRHSAPPSCSHTKRQVISDALHIQQASPMPNVAYFTATVTQAGLSPREAATMAYDRLASWLADGSWQVVHERVFGSLSSRSAILESRSEFPHLKHPAAKGPLTYIQGQPLWGDGLAGIQVQAVRLPNPKDVWDITDGTVSWGKGWRRSGVTYLLMQNIHGHSTSDEHSRLSRFDETMDMFDRAHQLLRQHGAAYTDVVRTWIYLSKILDWYGEFNEARNRKYQEFGLMPRQMDSAPPTEFGLPASTGIQGDNPLRAAAVMDVLAMTAETGKRPQIERLGNVRQKDAFRYGAAFCRGTVIRDPELCQFQISGTAAIDEQGVSLYPDNAEGQIQRTLDNLESLMEPVGAGFSKVCSATVFLKRAEDAAIYRQILRDRGLENLPAVCMVADICRSELLFELDAQAAWSAC